MLHLSLSLRLKMQASNERPSKPPGSSRKSGPLQIANGWSMVDLGYWHVHGAWGHWWPAKGSLGLNTLPSSISKIYLYKIYPGYQNKQTQCISFKPWIARPPRPPPDPKSARTAAVRASVAAGPASSWAAPSHRWSSWSAAPRVARRFLQLQPVPWRGVRFHVQWPNWSTYSSKV